MKKLKLIPVQEVIDLTRKRVFIDNDAELEDNFDDYIEEWESRLGMPLKKAFPDFVGEAYLHPQLAMEAILSHDDIFVHTSYVGESEDLFNNMLGACKRLDVKDKRIFNFRPSKYMHMQHVDTKLYWAVAKDNLFYYLTDNHKYFELSGASK